ncbi:MAG TPA: TIGR02266 family protein [Bdellovibrionota bacterium]|nr:TIGR02266 family protein [Bdellovibrionota bacterium]
MPKNLDKRQAGPRAKVELDIDLSTYGKYYLTKLENVSIGGAFVRTKQLHPIGTAVKMRFRLPGDGAPIEADGQVVWTYRQTGQNEPNSSGMGIKFTGIEETDRERIAKFVEHETRSL